jgi:hypothetical protein
LYIYIDQARILRLLATDIFEAKLLEPTLHILYI